MKQATLQSFAMKGLFVAILFNGCKSASEIENIEKNTFFGKKQDNAETLALSCTQQSEQTDYNVYRMYDDGVRIGDVMPFYDVSGNRFIVYNLKDVWNSSQRHPVYAFTTSNFYSYTQTGQIIASATDGCRQDYAIGTGSIYKNGSVYYFFYTGHNPNYPSSCVTKKEGIMLATSANPTSQFAKSSSFATIYAPAGQGFDETDNFRDPFIYYENGTYYMLLSARKNVNGTWRGVIIKYTSSNLTSWNYGGVVYDGGAINYFMMECAEIFKIGTTYYLLFSDINTKHVYYRKSNSINGPWNYPVGPDRFEGKGIYAAKTAADATDRYLFGWTAVSSGHTDNGATVWGGNLVVHKLYRKANGDLAVTIPHTLKANMETKTHPVIKNSQWGNVTNIISGTHSYKLISPADKDIANVIFDPINLPRYKIKATVSYTSSSKDFGFMIGACDGYNNFYSLRFVPGQNRFSLDKVNRNSLTTAAVAETDVPIALSPNTDYEVHIVIENSMLVVYINNEVALTTRIYKATNTHWGIFSDNSNASFKNIIVNQP